jgi:ribokinase
VSTVYVLGSVNEDLVLTCDRLPMPGETVLGHSAHRASGGKGANQAVAAARMGARVQMVAAVGADDAGRRQRANLLAKGVGTEHVRERGGADTALAVVVVDSDAENAIIVVSGANAELAAHDAAALAPDMHHDDLLLAQLEVPSQPSQQAWPPPKQPVPAPSSTRLRCETSPRCSTTSTCSS